MQTDTMGEKTKTFNMRLSPEEWAQFESVAKSYGLPVASMIRMFVKREYDAQRWTAAGGVSVGGMPAHEFPRDAVVANAAITRLVQTLQSAARAGKRAKKKGGK